MFKAANKSTVWYDARQLGPGFVPPRTWDEFVDTLRKLSDTGDTPLSVGGADGWTLTDWFENVYLQTAGGAMYDRLARHEIPWTDPSVRTALQTLGLVFRPEDMEDAEIVGGAQGSTLVSVADLVEAMGADAMVHFPVDAEQVRTEDREKLDRESGYARAASGGALLVGRFSPRTRIFEGQPITVRVDTEGLHFFDPDTGRSIRR